MSLFRLKYPNAKKGNVPGKALLKFNALFSYVNSPDKIVFFLHLQIGAGVFLFLNNSTVGWESVLFELRSSQNI